jgi:hypothetical protein
MTARTASRDVATALLALAAVILGHAVQMTNGFYHPPALAWVGLALVLTLVAVIGGSSGSRALAFFARSELTDAVLAAGIVSNLVALAFMPIGMHLTDPIPRRPLMVLAMLTIAGFALVGIVRREQWRRAWFFTALAAYFSLGMWLIHASPDPPIDVLVVHREAIAALLEGRSPYAITWPDIYGGGEYYAPNMTAAGRVLFGYPYPPLSLLLTLPAQVLFGDIRYSGLAATAGAAALVGLVRRERTAPLAAMLLLFTPRSFFVLEQGWTEPFALLGLAATVWCALRAPRWLPVALGLLVAVKQHMVVALPLVVLLTSPGGWRAWAGLVTRATAVAAVVTLPFLLWRTRRFIRAVVLLQFQEPFRRDSLSLAAFLSHQGMPPAPWLLVAMAVLALALGVALCLWRAARSPASFAGALALTLLMLFAVGKKAFCNYYYFVIGAMAVSVAAAEPRRHEELQAAEAPRLN